MVADLEQHERQRERVGPYGPLLNLALMLGHKEEVDQYNKSIELFRKFDELAEKRKAENCCKAVNGFMDKRWCKRCLGEFDHLNTISRYVDKISSGEVTWGHCEEAARRLKTIAEMPMPKMEEKSCECSPRKKMRVY